MSLDSFTPFRQFLVRLRQDCKGQDMIEYALLSSFMVIAIWALFPSGIVPSISTIFQRLLNVASVLAPG